MQPVIIRASYLEKTEGAALEQSDLCDIPQGLRGSTVEELFEFGWNDTKWLQNYRETRAKKEVRLAAQSSRCRNSARTAAACAEPQLTGLIEGVSYKARNQENGPKESDLCTIPHDLQFPAEDDRLEGSWHDSESLQNEEVGVASKYCVASESKPASPIPLGAQHVEEVARLMHAFWMVCGRRMTAAAIAKLFNTAVQFSFPLLIKALLQFFEEEASAHNLSMVSSNESNINKGYWLGALLMGAIVGKAISSGQYFHLVNHCACATKAAVSTAIYRKSFRLSNASQQLTTLGETLNLMQVDATKIELFFPQIHVLWDGIFQIVGYLFILSFILGWTCLVCLGVMLLATPIMSNITEKLFAQNQRMTKYNDGRVKVMNEALQGMLSVKMYTWEQSLEQSIGKDRTQEVACLRTIAYYRGFARAFMTVLPTLAAVATFLVYAYATDRPITASVLFSSLVAFDQLRSPLISYPIAFAQLAQAKNAVNRVSRYLGRPEINSGNNVSNVEDQTTERRAQRIPGGICCGPDGEGARIDDGVIVLRDVTVFWGDPPVSLPIKSTFSEQRKARSRGTEIAASANSTSSDVSFWGDSNETIDEERSVPSNYDADSCSECIVFEDDSSIVDAGRIPALSGLSLVLKKGQLCAVVGRIASGKSTLCSAILNEVVLESKSFAQVNGTIAYVAQTAWILNQTVRENILFGAPYDADRYKKVVEACQLSHDLALLDNGDQTEIGERGINLSGGQKQRISLARAAYSNADIIVMDDPLSALDPEVAGRIFDLCIVGVLKDKTRLLVTNQLQCLPRCDTVVALGQGGHVVGQGTYTELTENQSSEIKWLLNDLGKDTTTEEQSQCEDPNTATLTMPVGIVGKSKMSRKQDDQLAATMHPCVSRRGPSTEVQEKKTTSLTTKEEREVGAVKLKVYLKYLKAGGGYLMFLAALVAFLLSSAINFIVTAWVALWAGDTGYERQTQAFYVGGYALTALLMGFGAFLPSYFLATFAVKASKTMHENLLHSIMHAPMSFFDTTPTGRILSRFSKDLFSLDTELADCMDLVLVQTLQLLTSLATIVYASPWFGLGLLPLFYVYFCVLNCFRAVSRETKRLESISRSPVYSHFSETLGGLSTIRAYGINDKFAKDFLIKLDVSTQASYNNKSAERWLSVRLELIGALITGLAAISLSATVVNSESPADITPMAGLSLTYAVSITSLLNWIVRNFAILEAAMSSCERIFYYTHDIPQEAPATSAELGNTLAKMASTSCQVSTALAARAANGKVLDPEPSWPERGSITLKDLRMRYRPETPLVLKGLNVVFNGGMYKIVFCGCSRPSALFFSQRSGYFLVRNSIPNCRPNLLTQFF
jgi:ABC-type multidrug transport system fused ATPase/permease subunit